ncbi:MAG: SocA family protein [Candidatus Wallbacteria bacterium]|nr:SocA family protein [Candidatus Wallbacteria bacterium]
MCSPVDKFEAAVVYFANALKHSPTGLGHVKLAKLLFFSDKRHATQHGHSLTGCYYIHEDHGPMPEDFPDVLKDLEQAGAIENVSVPMPGRPNPRLDVRPRRELDDDELTYDEIKTLDHIAHLRGNLSGSMLEEESHKEPVYLATQPKKTIYQEMLVAKTVEEARAIYNRIEAAEDEAAAEAARAALEGLASGRDRLVSGDDLIKRFERETCKH